MYKPPDIFCHLEDCVPSLKAALEKEPLNLKKLIHVAVPVRNPDERPPVPALHDRRAVRLTDGSKICSWEVESLTALFRGDKQPPILGARPEAYEELFFMLDFHALEVGRLFGDPRDEEMLEVYSTLRRRPDGKSLGFVHDLMWQAVALVLASRVLSQAECEAILSRLERSCRTFRMGPTSKNYLATLHQTIGRAV